jgi:hypothetical protein
MKSSEPSEPSAIKVNNENLDCKPTTISALTTNAATATTVTATNVAVYRLGCTDTWACRNCKIKADKQFMYIYMSVVGEGEERSLTSINSSGKDIEEREEAKRRILDENPNIAKDALEFMLSLPVERKIPKVSELETIHATAEQQEEMERLLKMPD